MGIDIAPVKGTKSYEWKQPPKDYLPRCPYRLIESGPSASGKGILTQNLLLSNECYRGTIEKYIIAVARPIWTTISARSPTMRSVN